MKIENCKRKKRARRTSHLWKVIPRIFDLDATSVEGIHVHSLAVIKLICSINWVIVIIYYVLCVVYFFDLDTVFNFMCIWDHRL